MSARIRAAARRIARASIWSARSGVGLTKLERDMLRYFLPFFDVCMVGSGVFGYVYLVPALSDLWPGNTVDVICATFAGVAFVCLVGVAFPRLRTIELYAKDVLFLMLLGLFFTVAVILLGWTDVPPGPSVDGRFYFLPFVATAAAVPLLRILWITRLPPLPIIPWKGRR